MSTDSVTMLDWAVPADGFATTISSPTTLVLSPPPSPPSPPSPPPPPAAPTSASPVASPAASHPPLPEAANLQLPPSLNFSTPSVAGGRAIGVRLTEERRLAGLSPSELCRAAGIGYTELVAIERGSRLPSSAQMRGVLEKLKLTPADFTRGLGSECTALVATLAAADAGETAPSAVSERGSYHRRAKSNGEELHSEKPHGEGSGGEESTGNERFKNGDIESASSAAAGPPPLTSRRASAVSSPHHHPPPLTLRNNSSGGGGNASSAAVTLGRVRACIPGFFRRGRELSRGGEIYFEWEAGAEVGFAIKVFTTISARTLQAYPKGMDAIRVIVWDARSRRKIEAWSSRLYRTGDWQKRLREAVGVAIVRASYRPVCPVCPREPQPVAMEVRGHSGAQFWGCCRFADASAPARCRATRSIEGQPPTPQPSPQQQQRRGSALQHTANRKK